MTSASRFAPTEPSGDVRKRLADRAAAWDRWLLVLAPGIIAIALLFVWPLVGMAARSFTEPTLGLQNFERFIASPLAMRSLAATVSMAAVATMACVVIGYPYAYLMATAGNRWALVLGAIVLIPTAVSFLVRAFAMQLLLWDTGVINSVLRELGLIDSPLPLIRNHASVVVAMTALLLPLFVLPAYAVMRRIDPDYVRAAAVLGASPVRSFVRIFIPLSMPGVAAGSLLVFVIALGYYITPALFGDGRTLYLGELIVYYTTRLDWGLSSAVSLVLLVTTLVIIWVASRLVGFQDVFGVEVER
jgi:putative spermidine/putrescine transport system permease protein